MRGRQHLLNSLSTHELETLLTDWPLWARPDQHPPASASWRQWVVLGGRGAGKTRLGAEWIRALACGLPWAGQASVAGRHVHLKAGRIALIGETFQDVREVMIEGESGLMRVHPRHQRPQYEPTRRRLVWPNGAVGMVFSADDPDQLRGPQFEAVWADEMAKWPHMEKTWAMVQMALRLGPHPRALITTTPRPLKALQQLAAHPLSVAVHMPTSANAAHLAPGFLEAMEQLYGGTALARQEMEGVFIEDNEEALWRRDDIERHRLFEVPTSLQRIVVAVDPPAGGQGNSKARCGICVAGRGQDNRFYVLEDASISGPPSTWAASVAHAYHRHEADAIIAETNQGGDMVAAVLREVDSTLPVTAVKATRGKWLRAEPVAVAYRQGRVSHVGRWSALEDEMCAFTAEGRAAGLSPDRLDALVWALTALMQTARHQPRIRSL